MSKPNFPMAIKRGHAVVRIYKTPSNGCDQFTVVHYLGEKRRRKTFSDLGIAVTEAEIVATKLSEGELDGLTLGSIISRKPKSASARGHWHRESVVGSERAENISPTGWFLENGIKFSIHSDAPVIFPNSMQLIATAGNRTTRTGLVRHIKISPLSQVNNPPTLSI
jgi:hypothetical protein